MRAAVLGLEDFLEADEYVVGVVGVDVEELVVPGLDAHMVEGRALQRGAAGPELAGVGDPVPRPGGVPARRHEDATQRGLE